MTVEAIDAILSAWEERLRRVDESLLALEADPTFQMIAPRVQSRTLTEGQTERVVQPAIDALRELFEHRGRLTEVLERAKEIRASMSGLAFWANEDKEQRILELLRGPSIELGQEMTPLGRRALLDPGTREVRVGPEQLLAAMATAYEGARDAVVAVQRAWDTLEPTLVAAGKHLDDARASAASLGVLPDVQDEVAILERDLEALRARVARDPLGTSADLVQGLGPRVDALVARLGERASLRARVTDGLRAARELHEAVRAAQAGAVAAADRMPLEVEGASAPGLATDPWLIEGLVPWLSKIEAASEAGRWRAAEVGLTRWRAAAQGYADHDGAIARALSAVLARRDELAGRLSARRAQALARAARGGTIDPDAEATARQAEALLAQRPTPLGKAKELVERYERLVRSP